MNIDALGLGSSTEKVNATCFFRVHYGTSNANQSKEHERVVEFDLRNVNEKSDHISTGRRSFCLFVFQKNAMMLDNLQSYLLLCHNFQKFLSNIAFLFLFFFCHELNFFHKLRT